MALLEDDLPAVAKVRGDFRVREDHNIAHRLQEQEYEDHFNSNVQLRRTARHDVTVAKEIQDKETQSFKEEERIRLQELREREEGDRQHAEEVMKKLEEEERKHRERELKDQEHVAKLAQKMKEDEEVKKALRIQDEIMAKKLHEAEEKRLSKKKAREEADARLARQTSLESVQRRAGGGSGLSEREVQRMKQLQLQQRGAQPDGVTNSLQSPPRSNQQQGSRSVTASLPTDLDQVRTSNSQRSTASNSDTFQLPSYDQCIPDDEGYGMPGGEEVMMDENERIALQEAEDERLAREMMQREDDEAKRREREDMEFAHLMQQEEEAATQSRRANTHAQDLGLAKRLHEEGGATAPQSNHEKDMELARQLHHQELEANKKKQKKQEQLASAQDPSIELAMKLQREEVMRHKELKKKRQLAQQQAQQQQQQAQQQRLPQQQQQAQQQRLPQQQQQAQQQRLPQQQQQAQQQRLPQQQQQAQQQRLPQQQQQAQQQRLPQQQRPPQQQQQAQQQKLAQQQQLAQQQRAMAINTQERTQKQNTSSRQPPAQQNTSPFAGYEAPPLPSEDVSPPRSLNPRGPPSMQQQQRPSQNGEHQMRPPPPPSSQQEVPLPPNGQAPTSYYSYQPAMAGVQIPRPTKASTNSSQQVRPSFKRSSTDKKNKK